MTIPGFSPSGIAWADYEKMSNVLAQNGEPVIPEWIKARQIQATNTLEFVAAKPAKAEPLTLEIIENKLYEAGFGRVYEAHEVLDVWFIGTVIYETGLGWDIILYENMGEWKCSSLTKTLVFRPD